MLVRTCMRVYLFVSLLTLIVFTLPNTTTAHSLFYCQQKAIVYIRRGLVLAGRLIVSFY